MVHLAFNVPLVIVIGTLINAQHGEQIKLELVFELVNIVLKHRLTVIGEHVSNGGSAYGENKKR